jgi:ABC-type sugar transport system ATPase subunit
MAEVELKQIRKSYGKHEVIHGIDLQVSDGEFVVFVGPSGCGKSTLLRMIAGLEDITAGQLLIDGKVSNGLSPKERNIAMVFQSYALYPQMTVAQNMGFSLSLEHRPKKEINAKVEAAAAALKLEGLLERRPSQLSGGQRQRVAIGRAIVREPRVFLLDEPLSNLDAALRSETRVEISELHQRLRTTMIFVTHDQTEAMTMADRIVVLDAGIVQQVGTPMELYNQPVNRFVAGFIGSPRMNFFAGEAAVRVGAESIGVRPEHLALGDESSAPLTGAVSLVERLGNSTIVHVRLDDGGVAVASLDGQHEHQVGRRVGLSPAGAKVHRFDRQGNAMGMAGAA